MLKQRVMLIVLLMVASPGTLYRPRDTFLRFSLVLIGAGAWEWGRLNGEKAFACIVGPLYCIAFAPATWFCRLVDASIANVLADGWRQVGIRRRVSTAVTWSAWVGTTTLYYVLPSGCLRWAAWLAVARYTGIEFLLSILLVVWVADIGAYFSGKRFGGRFSGKKAGTFKVLR
jgi:phosphatidate cytidylyltransferase